MHNDNTTQFLTKILFKEPAGRILVIHCDHMGAAQKLKRRAMSMNNVLLAKAMKETN